MSGTATWQRFTIAIPNPDGNETIAPMKEWLRQHPEHVPFDPSEKNSLPAPSMSSNLGDGDPRDGQASLRTHRSERRSPTG